MARKRPNQETVPQYTSFPCYTDRRAVKKVTKKEDVKKDEVKDGQE